MVNKERNGSWPAFLIDLDLIIKKEREGFLGARGKIGTRAFMAIRVLLGGRKHSSRRKWIINGGAPTLLLSRLISTWILMYFFCPRPYYSFLIPPSYYIFPLDSS